MLKIDTLCEQNIDSYLFLDYIKSFGFNPENHSYILELFSSPKESISQFLNNYNQFLVSNSVNYRDLNELGIKGGCGYFTQSEIVVPKTLKNDDIFLHNKTISSFHKLGYDVPHLNDFDVIIGNGITKNISDLTCMKQPKFIGFCGNINSKQSKELLKEYKKLFTVFEFIKKNDYKFEYDTLKDKGKEMCLIRKK